MYNVHQLVQCAIMCNDVHKVQCVLCKVGGRAIVQFTLCNSAMCNSLCTVQGWEKAMYNVQCAPACAVCNYVQQLVHNMQCARWGEGNRKLKEVQQRHESGLSPPSRPFNTISNK